MDKDAIIKRLEDHYQWLRAKAKEEGSIHDDYHLGKDTAFSRAALELLDVINEIRWSKGGAE